jgi:hypothetical protein
MTLQIEKWRFVGGLVYRLGRVFDVPVDAVRYAKSLKTMNYVFLSRTKDGQWAVYWRSKEDRIECQPQVFSVN